MAKTKFNGVHEDAFAHKLKTKQYDGALKEKIVIENWYRLNFEDARRLIDRKDDGEWIEGRIERGNTVPDPWIKLITREYKNTETGKISRYSSTSLRPYVQGYGCDGTTDLNIHAIANRLAEQHGLDYPTLLVQAYPDDFSPTDDFQWLHDKEVLAETIIPEEIDGDVALRDLEEINNYTLAMKFGIALYNVGAIKTDWKSIQENLDKNLDKMRKQIEQDVQDWFAKQALHSGF